MNQSKFLYLMGLILALILSACGAGEPVETIESATPTADQALANTEATPSPKSDPLATYTPTPTTIGAKSAPTPTVHIRTELGASDPAEFQLATGQVQLVEAFAYW